MSYHQFGKTCPDCGQAFSSMEVKCDKHGLALVATPVCQQCNEILPIKIDALTMNYCPNCGARNPKIIPAPETKTTLP